MIRPDASSPYRSHWRNRLKDLAIVVVLALVLSAIAGLASGQVIYADPSWPAWYYQGCYTNECGQMVCNSQMPRPWLAPNVVIAPRTYPPDQTITRPDGSIYNGRPLPPADNPPANQAPATKPEPPKAPAQPSQAEQAKQDAQGWTPSTSPPAMQPQPSPAVVVSQPTLIVPGRVPDADPAFWRYDLTTRVRNAEWAIGGLEKDRQRDVAELRQAIAASTRPPLLPLPALAPAIAPPAVPPLVPAIAAAAPAAKTIVERVERTGALELAAQIAIVAAGGATVLGTGYGAWILAAKLGVKFLRYVGRAYLAHQAAASPASPTSSSPVMQTYRFDRATQQAVAVDSPPLVDQAPPETHYVSVESNNYARCSQWADEQVARKYADRPATAVEILNARSSLVKQALAGQRS